MSSEIEIERALLGAAILAPKTLELVDLDPGDFLHPAHRFVWNALQSLVAANKPVDPASVADELGARLNAAGGFSGITGLMSFGVGASSAMHHAERIRQFAMTRRINLELAEIRAANLEGDELLERVQAIGAKAASRQRGRARSIGQWAHDAFKQMEADEQRGERPGWYGRGLATGFPVLDALLGGIKPGVMTVLGGRPSHGKSGLTRNIADYLSSQGVGVHSFSLEDSGIAYAVRAMSAESGINLAKFASMKGWTPAERRECKAACGRLWSRKHWIIDEVSGLSSRDIGIEVRLHKEENQTQLVIVDYVGHMHEPAARQGDEMATITQAAKGLFNLSRSAGVAVLMLSQLSRKLEDRTDKIPQLSDLRSSGEIEQLAECVMFAHRASLFETDPAKHALLAGFGEIFVRKNKNGLTGTAKLGWDGPTTSFRNPDDHDTWREGWGQ